MTKKTPRFRHAPRDEFSPAQRTPASTAQAEIRHIQGGVLEDLKRATAKHRLAGFSPMTDLGPGKGRKR